RERDVEGQARIAQRAAGVARLAAPLLREVDVRPAGEEVLQGPVALAVAHEHQLADLLFVHARHCNWGQSPFSTANKEVAKVGSEPLRTLAKELGSDPNFKRIGL